MKMKDLSVFQKAAAIVLVSGDGDDIEDQLEGELETVFDAIANDSRLRSEVEQLVETLSAIDEKPEEAEQPAPAKIGDGLRRLASQSFGVSRRAK